MQFKEIAIPLAAQGVPVIRLQPKSKIPMDKAWTNLATTDIDKILAWHEETPGANCASVAKSDGVLFFETDEAGVIERYEKETGESFPQTFKVKSRDDRFHFYFLQTDESRACGNITQKEIPFGSLRQHNEYCVSPGSIHPVTNLPYELISDSPIVPIPGRLIEWLQKQIVKKVAAPSTPAEPGAKIPHGQIHDALVTEAGSLRRRGHTVEAIEVSLLSWAHEHCQAPIDESKVRQYARSMGNYEPSDPRLNNLKKFHTAESDVEILTEEKLAEMQKKVVAPKGVVEYPAWAWQGTLYEDFANLCGESNVVPKEFFIESVKTVVGAICGHRIYPHKIASQESRFYTVLMGPGGNGKSSALRWARDLFAQTGLLYELSQEGAYMNIGAAQGSFASANGLVKNAFTKHARLLQVYDEFTTLIEKFAILGSGGAFLDAANQLFESGTMPQMHTKEKSDCVITTLVHNSILGATTPRRWDSAFTKTSAEGSGFFQRLNFVANSSEDRVATLLDPDFTAIRDQFVQKIQPLEYQIVEVKKNLEANQMLDAWYKQKQVEWKGLSEDIIGRIQVMVHRNASHLAWLMSGDQMPDADNANVPIEVTCDEDIIERAIALAEYEVFVRKMYRPAEVNNDYARVEAAIRRNFVQTGGVPVSRDKLRHAINADRYGIRMFDNAISNLVQEGFIRIGKLEGEARRGRKTQLIMLVED